MAVPSINDPLRDELDDLGLTLPASTTGYHQVPCGLLPLVVVDLHVVAELEDDDLLRGFAGRLQRTLEARRWMRQHWSGTGDSMSTNATPDLYGYDEFIEQYLRDLTPMQRLKGLAPEERLQGLAPEERLQGLAPEERLKGLAPEERLKGLAPEQRLQGLAPEQRLQDLTEVEQVLALPINLLRLLPDDYIATLPAEVQAKVQTRREAGS